MSLFLRLLGITNAALWFGSAVFLAWAVQPIFSSSQMLEILPPSHAGAAAQVVLDRYYAVQFWCCGIASAHLVLDWLYAGRPLRRGHSYLLAGLLGLVLFSGLLVQPKLKRLHLDVYGMRSTPEQREQGRRSVRVWEGVVSVTNFLAVLGVWAYLWQVNCGGSTTRFVSAGKLRGLTNGVT